MSEHNRGPRRLKTWLDRPGGSSGPSRLLAQAGRLAKLARALQLALPESFAGQWQLAQVHPEALVLVTGSPTWAAQLRFWHTTLLDTVEQQAGFRPRTVQVRSTGYKPQPRQQPRSRVKMSEETASLIASSAATTEDARLRQALERLAQAGARKQNK